MTENKAKMAKIIEKCTISLSDGQINTLWKYHNLIQSRNQEYNLTGIRDFTETILKHYVDCLIIQKLTSIPFPLLDIGTGAGFPGILLSLLFPKKKIILAEPRRERIQFLKEARDTLHLENIEIYPKKITPVFKTKVKAVITRALEPIPKTLHRISSCLEQGGSAIFMKGPSVDIEIKNSKKLLNSEYEIIKNEAYALPLLNDQRRLVVIQRK